MTRIKPPRCVWAGFVKTAQAEHVAWCNYHCANAPGPFGQCMVKR